MVTPVFVSYYTADYTDGAKRLRDSLEKLGLPSDIRERPDLGNWYKNTHQKPGFLLEMMDHHKSAVVWIDSDAEVKRSPELILNVDAGVDLAASRYGSEPQEGKEMLCGTLFVNNSERGRELLRRWRILCKPWYELSDQPFLVQALGETHLCSFRPLPVEYCFIFDTHRKLWPDVEPIIEHLQASRTHRR